MASSWAALSSFGTAAGHCRKLDAVPAFGAGKARQGPRLLDSGSHLADYLRPLVTFGGRHPGEVEAPEIDADKIQQRSEDGEPPPRHQIPLDVVTVSGMTARNQHPVGALLESLEDHQRAHSASTGKPHQAHAGGVLETGGAGHVGAGIGAPITDQGDDVGLPTLGNGTGTTGGDADIHFSHRSSASGSGPNAPSWAKTCSSLSPSRSM